MPASLARCAVGQLADLAIGATPRASNDIERSQFTIIATSDLNVLDNLAVFSVVQHDARSSWVGGPPFAPVRNAWGVR